MSGNEYEVLKFLLLNKKIVLEHIGSIKSIRIPGQNGDIESLNSKLPNSPSFSKADLIINDFGVSIKQEGKYFLFNRLQRAYVPKLFKHLGTLRESEILRKLDEEIDKYHNDLSNKSRCKDWKIFFTEPEFKKLLKYLMLIGNPSSLDSPYPAKYILEAKRKIKNIEDINLYSFDKYFDKYKNKIFISFRRNWIGARGSEGKRAESISKKEGNKPWQFDNVKGEPKKSKNNKSRWRYNVKPKERKTVYTIFMEKT